MSTHVCLVSEQLIPNVLPALAERPRQAILLVTPQMKSQGELLEKFLRERGIKTISHSVPAYNFAGILATCAEVMNQFCTSGETITLNVTSGTKIAALAAYQQFYYESQRIIYMDTAHSRILELGDSPIALPLTENLLKVKDYLACYGKYLTPTTVGPSLERVRQRRQVTTRLCRIFVQNPAILREINWRASTIRKNQPQLPFILFPDSCQGKGAQIGNMLVEGNALKLSESKRSSKSKRMQTRLNPAKAP